MPAELATTLTPSADDRLMQAEGQVRGYCGWHIAPSRADETFVLRTASPVLLLPSLHVTAAAVTDADGVEVDPAAYFWTEAGVLSYCSGRWWAAGTTVTFTHGYAEVPADITAAVQAIASSDVSLGVLKSKATGPFSESYTGQEAATMATLDRYKIPPRP